MLSSSIVVLY